jgi:predicted transcriptional regulator
MGLFKSKSDSVKKDDGRSEKGDLKKLKSPTEKPTQTSIDDWLLLMDNKSQDDREKVNENNNSLTQENSTATHRITETNSNSSSIGDKNSTEVNREHTQNFPNFPVNLNHIEEKNTLGNLGKIGVSLPKLPENFAQKDRDKFKTGAEPSLSEEEEIEDEGIEIKDNVIIIKTKDEHRFEIFYGFTGTIDDTTRIIGLKIPQLPQFELTAKKKDEVLSILVTVDFYQVEGKTIYYIRNRKEVIEKLYLFSGKKHISKKLLNDALDVWLDRINPEKHIKWVDVREVVKKYKEWEEINQDPLNFFLSRAGEVVGNEKLKVAVLLSVVSSQLKRLYGIYRVHLILTGSSGVGKSSTIKSVLKLFYDNTDGVEDFIVLKLTRMTKEALGRLNVDTLDGKVLFVEQLDNVEGVDYMREAMSEDRITTLTTVKDPEGNLVSKTIVIPGQPAFITTNVTANIDHQILNRSIQLYLSPTEDEGIKEKIIRSILMRKSVNENDLAKLKLVTYVWLKTRPNDPEFTEAVGTNVVNLLKKFINFKNIYRATEITRNLIRAVASMFGHEKVEDGDVEFVMKYFKKDIILTTLELSERDLQLLRWLRDHGFVTAEKEEETKDVTTSEIAQVIKLSTQETKKVLDALYDKGLLWKAYDGKRFTWAINKYGIRVLEELEKEVEEGQGQGGGEESEVLIEDQLLGFISSRLLKKDKVTEEELRGILEETAQAKDIEAQDLLIKILEKKGIIKNEGDGTWKVSPYSGPTKFSFSHK